MIDFATSGGTKKSKFWVGLMDYDLFKKKKKKAKIRKSLGFAKKMCKTSHICIGDVLTYRDFMIHSLYFRVCKTHKRPFFSDIQNSF